MSIKRWMDKESVVHKYNGILLSHKKECIWTSSNEVDELRAYYTEWSKSEREKQILTRLSDFFLFSLPCIEEGNGNPLQCSCLENPRDSVAWWAAVFGVAQSRTRLKRLNGSSSSNAYIWNLERWYWWNYLQGRDMRTDIWTWEWEGRRGWDLYRE